MPELMLKLNALNKPAVIRGCCVVDISGTNDSKAI